MWLPQMKHDVLLPQMKHDVWLPQMSRRVAASNGARRAAASNVNIYNMMLSSMLISSDNRAKNCIALAVCLEFNLYHVPINQMLNQTVTFVICATGTQRNIFRPAGVYDMHGSQIRAY